MIAVGQWGELCRLCDYSDAVVPAITAVLSKNQDPYVRRLATVYLAQIGVQAKSALPVLKDGLTDPDPDLKRAFKSAIAQIEGARSLPGHVEEMTEKVVRRLVPFPISDNYLCYED
jgi:HEAT repeat protein